SGLFFVMFVFMHAYGNLKILDGPQAYAGYAHHLRTFGEPILPYEGLLWIMRIGMLVLIVAHVGSALHLWARGKRGRGTQKYDVKAHVVQNYATRTMRVGGVLLLVFIVFHIFHFTTKHIQIGNTEAYGNALIEVEHAGVTESIPAAPWNMMVTTFSNWWMVLIYGVAVAILAFHISHGIWSALQTFGWLRANTRHVAVIISGILGGLLFLMFIVPPLYLLITQPEFVGI
ncbi:MAG: succinate dehydrogenase cytochrome b subunit, partial [Actinomycetaceae bacterium]|nr:succinate dehydrogenase cytochrome b subunit [Actinomycetaceae bacterium]